MSKEIIDRLETWMNKAVPCMTCDYRDFWKEQKEVLRALRAADEKATRLPEILTRCLNDGNNIALRRIHDTGYSAALVSRGPTGACEYATTPEAAIDALSAVLEKDKA